MEKMATTNPDGAGIAYREGDIVKWEKGLTLDEIMPLALEVPLPYVLHFRIASCGGKTKEMTHPFPIEKDVRLDLSGRIKGYVLFHNGHWTQYKDKGIDGAIKNRVKVPDGKWSDTRVMAWLAHMHGHGILELIDEKVILFGPTKIEIFHPEGWFRVNELLVSNRIWEHHYVNWAPYMMGGTEWEGHDYAAGVTECRMVNCHKQQVVGGSYCVDHMPACRETTCSKPRINGSDYCWDHRPNCIHAECRNKRVEGQVYCMLHLPPLANRHLEAPVNGNHTGSHAQPPEQPGGAAQPVVPFRDSTEPVQVGPDQQGGVAPPPDGVGKVGGEVKDGQVVEDSDSTKSETFRRIKETFQSPWSKPIRPMDIIDRETIM